GGFAVRASFANPRLDLSSHSHPVLIGPGRESTLALELHNGTDSPIVVRQVQLRGKAFEVSLVSYNVLIQARVPAHSNVNVDVPVDFGDLDTQVTALFPPPMPLLDPPASQLATQDFTMDVRGNALS